MKQRLLITLQTLLTTMTTWADASKPTCRVYEVNATPKLLVGSDDRHLA